MLCEWCQERPAKIKFCSRSCSVSARNFGRPRKTIDWTCRTCSKPALRQRAYCKICFENRVNVFLIQWLAGANVTTPTGLLPARVRQYLISNSDGCSQCGWNKINPTTKRIPLEVDHIDGAAWLWEVTINGAVWLAEGSCDYTGWDCQSSLLWSIKQLPDWLTELGENENKS